jgi:hypothetical protein
MGMKLLIIQFSQTPVTLPLSLIPIFSPVFGQKEITVFEHPWYSPDLVLRDLFMFPKLKIKISLNGSHFKSLEDIQTNVAILRECLKNYFQKYFQTWQIC